MPESSIKERLLREEAMASREAEKIRDGVWNSEGELRALVRAYILFKLSLYDPPSERERINELVRDSLIKTLRAEGKGLEKLDVTARCDGSNAVRSKRILLFMAVQRSMGIKLPPDKTAGIDTVGDLTALVLAELRHLPEGELKAR